MKFLVGPELLRMNVKQISDVSTHEIQIFTSKLISSNILHIYATGFYRAVFSFLSRFTETEKDDFMDDFINGMRRMRIGADATGKVYVPFTYLVVFARK